MINYIKRLWASHKQKRSGQELIPFTLICQECTKKFIVKAAVVDVNNWQVGGYSIHQAFPYLSKGDKKLLTCSTCIKCAKKTAT